MAVAGNDTEEVSIGRVFISYARADAAMATTVREALEDSGLAVESPVESPQPGESILALVVEAIDRSDVVVVLLSEDSASSHWVQTESSLAVGRFLTYGDGEVIPVVIGDGADLPFLLRDFASIRVAGPSDRSGLQRLVSNVIAASRRVPARRDVSINRGLALQRRSLDDEYRRYETLWAAESQRIRTRFLGTVTLALTALLASILPAALLSSDILRHQAGSIVTMSAALSSLVIVNLSAGKVFSMFRRAVNSKDMLQQVFDPRMSASPMERRNGDLPTT